MPPQVVVLYSGVGLVAAIAVITLTASVLTLIASWVLLQLYRRKVRNFMQARAAPEKPTVGNPAEQLQSIASDTRHSRGNKSSDSAASDDFAQSLYRCAPRGPWRYAGNYACAGVLYALVLAAGAYYAFSQTQINPLAAAKHPLQLVFLFWTFLWPIILTVVFIAYGPKRYLLLAGYFAALVILGALTASIPTEAALPAGDVTMTAWSGETPLRLFAKWHVYNLAPTILIVAFRNRRVRAVAPLVLSFTTVVLFGLLGAYAAAFYYMEQSVAVLVFLSERFGLSARSALIIYFALLATVTCLAFSLPGWWLMKRIRGGYERKTINDQSLALDALWLICAAFYTAVLAFGGIGWAVLALLDYVLFKLVLKIAKKLGAQDSDQKERGPALLILRVFSLGKRSEVLFDVVSRHWRYVGSVQLIAGPDLAISTVAPHRFLAFLTGRLRYLFINDAAAMDDNLRNLDTAPDVDGRFRINDFFCRADTWQSVLQRLVNNSDAVLMDLRSFTENNDGCIFEINELLSAVPVARLVFVTDATTDKDFLRRILETGCVSLTAQSPNFGLSASDVRPLELPAATYGQIRNLLQSLCAAAGG